jgi:hypothetical protein
MKKPLIPVSGELIHELTRKPFDVLYESVSLSTFEVLIDPAMFSIDKKNGYSGSLEDWIRRQKGLGCAIEVTYWTLENAIFRCKNQLESGIELFLIMGEKCERAPEFLSLHMKDSDRDLDQLQYSQRHTFTVEDADGGYIRLDDMDGPADFDDDIDDDESSDFDEEEATDFEEYEHAGPSLELYDLDSHPILILDPEGSRIKIDHQGYQLDERHERISKAPLVKYPKTFVQDFLKNLSKSEKSNLLRLDAGRILGKWFHSK